MPTYTPARRIRICSLAAIGLMLLTLSHASLLSANEPILLWPDGAPGAKGDEPHDKPHLRIYRAAEKNNTQAAVVICPGGGYGALATDHEDVQVAKRFNRMGVNAFVLKYRLSPHYQHPAPLQDVQRAIRYVRANATKLLVDPARVGVMGFSAGGHLASTAATQFDAGDKSAKSKIEQQSCRPDFAILGYPVISFTDAFAHRGSRRNLLGKRNDDEKLANQLSNHKRVTEKTPPTFLFHTGEDKGVPVENSLAFYAALRKAKVPAELHVYQFGPHGVGMADGDPVVHSWMDRLHGWMKTSGLLAKVERAAISGRVQLNGKPLRWGAITFVPADSNKPVAWSMISRGRFNIPQNRGAVRGKNRVLIRNLGDVKPDPTIDDVQTLAKSSLVIEVAEENNVFQFDLKQD